MVLIDIYDRYQDVDWSSLSPVVGGILIKGTDGYGRAVVSADSFVRGAKTRGLPVGLYHYAQAGDPVRQANVLADEVARLGANAIPPALDFEGDLANSLTSQQGRSWCSAFVDQLRRRGHPRVFLYANTTHLNKIYAPAWAATDPHLLIWAARYGVNDGVTYPGLGSYTGRVDLHQWTDKGRVTGVTYPTDLNRSLTNWMIGDEYMPTADEIVDALLRREVTRQGLPAEDPRAGKKVAIQAIFEWFDAQFVSLIVMFSNGLQAVLRALDENDDASIEDIRQLLREEVVKVQVSIGATPGPDAPQPSSTTRTVELPQYNVERDDDYDDPATQRGVGLRAPGE